MQPASAPRNSDNVQDISDDDMALYVGKDWKTYEPVWRQIRHNEPLGFMHHLKGFNILAFLMAPVWFLYRKLYIYAALYVVFVLAIDFILSKLGVTIPAVVYSATVAFVSRILYLRWAVTKIRAIRQQNMGDAEASQKIATTGGVSMVAGLISGGLVVVMVVVMAYGAYMAAKENYPQPTPEIGHSSIE